jgi:hypothetical protein
VFAGGLLLASHGAAAQEWARKMFEETSHDFGAVARGAKVEHRFVFKNIYKEDIHISSVRSSCGCTEPEVTKHTLKTHETAEVVAVYNTRAFTGSKSATLTLTIDQPYYGEVQLHVGGYIRTDVVLHPGEVEFGTVSQGAAAEKKIAVKYAGRDDWQIVGVQSHNPHITGEVKETARGGGQVHYDLIVRLAEGAPSGYLNDTLVLNTNDRRATTVPVQIQARVASELSVSPASLFMGVLKPGQKVTKKLVVRGVQPFRIVDVKCEDKCFEFETEADTKPLHLIPVTFVAGNKPGKVTQTIKIETDLEGAIAKEISAYAQVVPETVQ